MVKMPMEVIKLLERVASKSLCVLATASKDGKPNAVPIIFAWPLGDDKILVADNFFNKTRINMEENPRASLTFWDPETREGYQVKGIIEIHTSGPIFEEAALRVRAIKSTLKTKAGVVLRVEEVYTIKPGPDAGKRIA
ncbi:MAG: pyridoxamine 5'-phosphate oxidase family protein [Candidatus Nezhaarchaeota archaeon]|nr:pyridoxamine 5'-phosphate oxidase family protein [Candidatus Nezhaarchaeota archaeon]MCX8141660.1 pyridoxamine 5'-phosphate oxidase family protein [Candidatus Nezhaarchaeota archaeon]MDW8049927.1 pyridoxamine 5'-phosphate oxidase family protein [Nitrososphaerota archaeon]